MKIWKETCDKDSEAAVAKKVCHRRGEGLQERLAQCPDSRDSIVSDWREGTGGEQERRRKKTLIKE